MGDDAKVVVLRGGQNRGAWKTLEDRTVGWY